MVVDCEQRFRSDRLPQHCHALHRRYGWPILGRDIPVVTDDAGRIAIRGIYWIQEEAIKYAGHAGRHYATVTYVIETRRHGRNNA